MHLRMPWSSVVASLALAGCSHSADHAPVDATIGTGGSSVTTAAPSTGGSASAGGAAATGGVTPAGGAMGGSDGTAASGGEVATGGRGGSGGSPSSGGIVGAGGVPATGGRASSDGGPSSGGIFGSGGVFGFGGALITGGRPGSGGIPSSGGAGGGGSGIDGAVAGECNCAGGQTTLDCFCKAYNCNLTLSSFGGDAGGDGYALREEYANCGLVVITSMSVMSPAVYVFDLTTGRLVGEEYMSDVAEPCRFGGDARSYTLSAGRFPDSTCIRSKCSSNGNISGLRSCPDGGV